MRLRPQGCRRPAPAGRCARSPPARGARRARRPAASPHGGRARGCTPAREVRAQSATSRSPRAKASLFRLVVDGAATPQCTPRVSAFSAPAVVASFPLAEQRPSHDGSPPGAPPGGGGPGGRRRRAPTRRTASYPRAAAAVAALHPSRRGDAAVAAPELHALPHARRPLPLGLQRTLRTCGARRAEMYTEVKRPVLGRHTPTFANHKCHQSCHPV